MDSIYSGLEQLGDLIIWPYLASFILLSYLIKRNFEKWLNKVTNARWKSVYSVLIIATILSIPFMLFYESGWENILLTYAVGTSLYELILGKLLSKAGGGN